MERNEDMFKKFSTLFMAGTIVLAAAAPAQAATTPSADQIIATAKNYLGIPYVWGGTTTRGFDCSGYLNFVFNKHGVSLPRTVSEIYKVGTSVSKDNLQVGDLVFFETYKKGASHAGIYIGNNQFIHAGTVGGVQISSINDPYYWKARYIGAKRILPEKVTLPKGEFFDVAKSHWAYPAINDFTKRGIISGYEDQTFKPNSNITRAQAATILVRLLNLPAGNAVSFADVNQSHWAYAAIAATNQAGIFTGDEQNRFKPNDPLTRAQFAVIVDRIYAFEQKGTINFPDTEEHWAEESIEKLASNGIFNGYTSGYFGPNDTTTRAQFVGVLYKVEHTTRK